MIHYRKLEKIFYLFSNSVDCKSLWKRVSNLIQIINDYGVKKKHDLTS